ncbi:MAG: ATP-binding cassette domain-containing protein [Candidatus Rifleibacteriota bacterium]
MNPAIKVENLSKIYGQKNVVDHISFEVESGQIFGFLGPNGAGKTTSIRMMIGEIAKDDGNIEINGLKIPQHLSKLKNIIGVVPDHQNLYDRLTVRQNLEFFAELNSVEHSKIDEILAKVFLGEHQHKQTYNLSRGLRQRTLIARELLHNPSIFFLDEPTSALDPNSALLIRDLVKELKANGTTVFLTTHYMEEADALCDNLAIMHQGKIVACGKSEELKKNYAHNSMIIEYQSNQAIQSAEFSLTDLESRKKAAKLIENNEILKVHSQEPSLEEVFLNLTGSEWKSEQEKKNEI